MFLLLEFVQWIVHVCQRKPQKNFGLFPLTCLRITVAISSPYLSKCFSRVEKKNQTHKKSPTKKCNSYCDGIVKWLLWWMSQCRLPCCPQVCQLRQLRGLLWGTQPSVPSTGKRVCVPFCAVGCCDSHKTAGTSLSIWMSISICVPESKHQCLPSCLLIMFLTGLWHLQERNPILPCSSYSLMLRLASPPLIHKWILV